MTTEEVTKLVYVRACPFLRGDGTRIDYHKLFVAGVEVGQWVGQEAALRIRDRVRIYLKQKINAQLKSKLTD